MQKSTNNKELHRPGSRRVLLVIGSLGGGGAERQITQMANYWDRHGWNVTLATMTANGTTDSYFLHPTITRVHLLASKRGMSSRILRTGLVLARLRMLMTRFDPDFTISFLNTTNILTLLASLGTGRRVIVSERNNPQFHLGTTAAWKFLRRLVFRLSFVVVAQTSDVATWMRQKYSCRTIVIPNVLRTMDLPDLMRKKSILTLGRLHHCKGIDILLFAFSRIASIHPDWNLDIVGDGNEKEKLASLAQDLGIDDRVKWHAWTKEVEPWFRSTGIFAHPSRYEGYPNALLEAMASGCAVVAADCPSGPSEIINHGINGLLIRKECPEALARALDDLIRNPTLRIRLGAEATNVKDSHEETAIMDRWTNVCLGPACL
jgi:GalNAc-alpha-(1->4)-GalNAc-alpha-(1->3)-diNAcBac-PP-undecaprenol alpha-1,4-N-acetyl-D-galactosaminyltransferase